MARKACLLSFTFITILFFLTELSAQITNLGDVKNVEACNHTFNSGDKEFEASIRKKPVYDNSPMDKDNSGDLTKKGPGSHAFAASMSNDLTLFLEKLHDHIKRVSALTANELRDGINTVKTFTDKMDQDEATIAKIFDIIKDYDNNFDPLFVAGPTRGGFQRDINQTSGIELEHVMFALQQGALDVVYDGENIQNFTHLFENTKYQSSDFFPGAVEAPENSNVTFSTTIRARYRDPWGINPGQPRPTELHNSVVRPTGYYLAPGSVAIITVPSHIVNKGFKIQVGGHPWDLKNKNPIRRFDRVSKHYIIDRQKMLVANPLGGGIYINVPYLADEGEVEISLQNVVKAPFYSQKDFDQTDLTEWKNTIRNYQTPYAVLESDHVLFQVPSAWVRNLDDPETLMNDWEKATNAVTRILGRPNYSDMHHIYSNSDLILRGSAYHPGYPESNTVYNPYSPKNPGGVDHISGPLKLTWQILHEYGHGVAISKFPWGVEAIVNFITVIVESAGFGIDMNTALKKSLWESKEVPEGMSVLDYAARGRMQTESFQNGAKNRTGVESRYQYRGYAFYSEIVNMFGWCALQRFWHNENVDFMNGIDHGKNDQNTDNRILRMSIAAGIDLSPLLHFYGLTPRDPSTLKNNIQSEGLLPSKKIYARLQHYKTLIELNDTQEQTLNVLQSLIDLYYPNGTPADNDPEVDNDCNDDQVDCNGDSGGDAFMDMCGECVGGNTNKQACKEQEPYSGSAISIPGKVEAEHYDIGGQGVSYSDNSPGNVGDDFRQDDVDIELLGNSSNYAVAWIQAGEWLEYTINSTYEGEYQIIARVASPKGEGSFRLELDGIDITNSISLIKTDSWFNYEEYSVGELSIPQGEHILRVYIEEQGLNLDYLNFTILTSLQNLDNENLIIYPTPTDGILNISGISDDRISEVEILDLKGRVIQKSILNKDQTIDIGSLESGVYFIKAGNARQKIVKVNGR